MVLEFGGFPHFHRHSKRKTINDEWVGWTFHIATSNFSNVESKFNRVRSTVYIHNSTYSFANMVIVSWGKVGFYISTGILYQ